MAALTSLMILAAAGWVAYGRHVAEPELSLLAANRPAENPISNGRQRPALGRIPVPRSPR